MGLKTKLLTGQIRVYKGTPRFALAEPALFLNIRRVRQANNSVITIATLTMARPTGRGYVIKELLTDMQLPAEAAVEKAVDIALRGQVHAIFLNAELDMLPVPAASAAG